MKAKQKTVKVWCCSALGCPARYDTKEEADACHTCIKCGGASVEIFFGKCGYCTWPHRAKVLRSDIKFWKREIAKAQAFLDKGRPAKGSES